MSDNKDLTEQYAKMTMEELEKLVGDQEITPINVFIFSVALQQFVERFKDLKGIQKRDLIMKIFEEYLDRKGGDTYGALSFLPSFINSSISIDKGEVNIKIQPEEVMSCCASLLSFAKKN